MYAMFERSLEDVLNARSVGHAAGHVEKGTQSNKSKVQKRREASKSLLVASS